MAAAMAVAPVKSSFYHHHHRTPIPPLYPYSLSLSLYSFNFFNHKKSLRAIFFFILPFYFIEYDTTQYTN